MDEERWFAVQCVFKAGEGERGQSYEERITVWKAHSADEAFERARSEAEAYATSNGYDLVDYQTSCALLHGPSDGREVWSVLRNSWLAPKEYVERFVIAGDPDASPFDDGE